MSVTGALVSIIMPAYNAEGFIGDAIRSVQNQVYVNWELIVVDDGSTDGTSAVVSSFTDSRINYYYQSNSGVSAARNRGLRNMSGTFFCFLDADDVLPPGSLASRIGLFNKHPDVTFVDGCVTAMDTRLEQVVRYYKPRFSGIPYNELKQLSDSCFYGITWMIRRVPGFPYAFPEDKRYAEDLLFYLGISKHGAYAHVDEVVYINRQVGNSAMQNLQALAAGYQQLLAYLLQHHTYSSRERCGLIYKVRVIIGKLLVRNFYNEQKKRFSLRLL